MIQSARIKTLADAPVRPDGRYVLYWMQQSQRADENPALEYAVAEAVTLNLPVVVCFGLTAYPEANLRHYAFMLEGLADVARRLEARGVAFVLRRLAPDALALELSAQAAMVVCDRGYLKIQRTWRARLAQAIGCRLVQVEGDVVVPVETASPKHEFAARTLRPRLHRQWEDYVQPLARAPDPPPATGLRLPSDLDPDDPLKLARSLPLETDPGPVRRFQGGETQARARLARFLDAGVARYGAERGRPEAEAASFMSPYLHFGQISPVEIALAVRAAPRAGPEDRSSYLEELIVRRELSMNHVFYEPAYDRYDSLPDWARRTLAEHAADPRPHLYTPAQFEAGETHDRYWNAAMREMRETGYMHNHLRMYWGKKILQWSAEPEAAFETTLRLNNRYFLDGRDANSFTNVGWIFGLHDRPWGPQPVFGTVRAMGLNTFRKFDAEAYVRQVDQLARQERA